MNASDCSKLLLMKIYRVGAVLIMTYDRDVRTIAVHFSSYISTTMNTIVFFETFRQSTYSEKESKYSIVCTFDKVLFKTGLSPIQRPTHMCSISQCGNFEVLQ